MGGHNWGGPHPHSNGMEWGGIQQPTNSWGGPLGSSGGEGADLHSALPFPGYRLPVQGHGGPLGHFKRQIGYPPLADFPQPASLNGDIPPLIDPSTFLSTQDAHLQLLPPPMALQQDRGVGDCGSMHSQLTDQDAGSARSAPHIGNAPPPPQFGGQGGPMMGGPEPNFPMAIHPNYQSYNHYAHGGRGTMAPPYEYPGDPRNMMPTHQEAGYGPIQAQAHGPPHWGQGPYQFPSAHAFVHNTTAPLPPLPSQGQLVSEPEVIPVAQVERRRRWGSE